MKNITIIAASDIKLNQTINSLLISSKCLNPSECILFSSKKLNKDLSSKGIKYQNIPPIKSMKDYSDFIIFELHKYIKTSHVLIVQWDGFIINPKKWEEFFLDYDYIGAPLIPRNNSNSYARDSNGDFYIIGNGGFSLRSKRLLEAPFRYNLTDDKRHTNHHEDGFFSVFHRKFLESKKFKWAPYQIAKLFSIESPLSFSELIELPFGFHGKKLLPIVKLKRIKDFIFNIRN